MNPPVSQREFAKRFARSPSAINLWEAGTNQPNAEDLAEISRWFDVSCDWLLGVDTDKRVPQKIITGGAVQLNTVPVVHPSSMVRWQLDAPVEFLQTSVAYPENTAAAMLVSSDALTSVCPTGCYAVVSKGHTAEPGQIVLVALSKAGDPVLRKFLREGNDKLLVADDSRFPTHRVDDGVKIIGRVTEVIARRVLN